VVYFAAATALALPGAVPADAIAAPVDALALVDESAPEGVRPAAFPGAAQQSADAEPGVPPLDEQQEFRLRLAWLVLASADERLRSVREPPAAAGLE
jgi:hypothetical protein